MKNGNNNNCLHCTKRSPIFQFLSDEELELINQNRYEVSYKPGETIFKQYAPITHVISMNQGLAKIHVEGSDDKEFILRIVKPVEFIAGVGLFLDNKHHYSMTAIDKVCVCLIDSIVFKDILKNNSAFNEAYLFHIHYSIADSLKRMISRNQKNTRGRIAESILYLANEIYLSDTFNTHLSKVELAELAGVSRESAFKAIYELQTSSIVNMEGNTVRIINKSLLERICEKG